MPVLLLVTHKPPGGRVPDPAARKAAARRIADVSGLLWKIWIADHISGEAGGVYLFEDAASADAWAEQVAQLLTESTDAVIRLFSIDADLSVFTRGPLPDGPDCIDGALA